MGLVEANRLPGWSCRGGLSSGNTCRAAKHRSKPAYRGSAWRASGRLRAPAPPPAVILGHRVALRPRRPRCRALLMLHAIPTDVSGSRSTGRRRALGRPKIVNAVIGIADRLMCRARTPPGAQTAFDGVSVTAARPVGARRITTVRPDGYLCFDGTSRRSWRRSGVTTNTSDVAPRLGPSRGRADAR